jgi:hypothetical protein
VSAANNDAESATSDAESATSDAESATSDAESATSDAESATSDAESATSDTVSDAEGTADGSALTFKISQFPEKLAIVRLAPGAEVPRWAESSSLFSITATAAETSLICANRSVPQKTPSIKPLVAFMVHGPLDPALTGVLAGLLQPLADAKIPVYPLSTFDTDWILVPVALADKAAEEWRRRGHDVAPAVPATPRKSQR